MHPRRHWLASPWVPVVAAGLVRGGLLLVAGGEAILTGDSGDYLAAAEAMRTRQPYPESPSLPFWRPPGYPALLAVVGPSLAVVAAVQIVIDLAALVLFGGLLGRVFGARAGILGRWAYALYPPFAAHALAVQTETLFQALLIGTSLVLLPGGGGRPGSGRLAAAGVLLGVAALVRPSALLLLPLVVAWILMWRGDAGIPRRARGGAVFALAFLLTLTPWAARNQSVYGEWVWVTDAAWFNLWYTTTPGAVQALRSPHEAQAAIDTLLSGTLPTMSEGWPPTPLADRTAFWRARTLEAIAEDPATFVETRLRGIWATWRPWVLPGFYPPRIVAVSVVLFLPWLVMGWWGAVWAWRAHPTTRPFLGLVAAYALVAVASNLLATPILRYRIPLVDPYFIGMACARIAAWMPPGEDV